MIWVEEFFLPKRCSFAPMGLISSLDLVSLRLISLYSSYSYTNTKQIFRIQKAILFLGSQFWDRNACFRNEKLRTELGKEEALVIVTISGNWWPEPSDLSRLWERWPVAWSFLVNWTQAPWSPDCRRANPVHLFPFTGFLAHPYLMNTPS